MQLSPIQVLTINMVTSVTLGLVLALEKPEPDVMDRKPRDPKQPLLDAQLGWRTFYVTVLLVTAMLVRPTLREARLHSGPSSSALRNRSISFVLPGLHLPTPACRVTNGGPSSQAAHWRKAARPP